MNLKGGKDMIPMLLIGLFILGALFLGTSDGNGN